MNNNNSQENIGCPHCNISNTAEFWDSYTKEKEGIKDDRPYISASAPKDEHIEQEAYFVCPMCGREVPGVNLKREEEV